jgi:cellobiose-specific phosphotransferase system component IIB
MQWHQKVVTQNLVSQIVDAVKKAFIEKDKERQLSTQLFVTKMKAQYEKSNKKLERILQENKKFKEELKQTKVAFCVKQTKFFTEQEKKQMRRYHAEEVKILLQARAKSTQRLTDITTSRVMPAVPKSTTL